MSALFVLSVAKVLTGYLLIILGETTLNSFCCGSCFPHNRIFCVLSYLGHIQSVSYYYLFYTPNDSFSFDSVSYVYNTMHSFLLLFTTVRSDCHGRKNLFFSPAPDHFNASKMKGAGIYIDTHSQVQAEVISHGAWSLHKWHLALHPDVRKTSLGMRQERIGWIFCSKSVLFYCSECFHVCGKLQKEGNSVLQEKGTLAGSWGWEITQGEEEESNPAHLLSISGWDCVMVWAHVQGHVDTGEYSDGRSKVSTFLWVCFGHQSCDKVGSDWWKGRCIFDNTRVVSMMKVSLIVIIMVIFAFKLGIIKKEESPWASPVV